MTLPLEDGGTGATGGWEVLLLGGRGMPVFGGCDAPVLGGQEAPVLGGGEAPVLGGCEAPETCPRQMPAASISTEPVRKIIFIERQDSLAHAILDRDIVHDVFDAGHVFSDVTGLVFLVRVVDEAAELNGALQGGHVDLIEFIIVIVFEGLVDAMRE